MLGFAAQRMMRRTQRRQNSRKLQIRLKFEERFPQVLRCLQVVEQKSHVLYVPALVHFGVVGVNYDFVHSKNRRCPPDQPDLRCFLPWMWSVGDCGCWNRD